MFETVVSNLIVKYLGKYIDIPPDSLNISLFSGNVELRNVKIKQSATYQFEEIPVTVIQGLMLYCSRSNHSSHLLQEMSEN